MKLKFWAKTLTAISLVSLLGSAAMVAAEMDQYRARPGGFMRIEGTSTVHDWQVVSKIIGGALSFPAGYSFDPAQESASSLPGPAEVKVTIPIKTLKSVKDSGVPYSSKMDDVMYETMGADKNPRIEFELSKMVPSALPRKAGEPLKYDAEGKLTLNGVTKEIKFPVLIEPQPRNQLKIKGQTQVKMTDFGMQPPAPKMALGLIKTGDDVTLKWEWLVGKK